MNKTSTIFLFSIDRWISTLPTWRGRCQWFESGTRGVTRRSGRERGVTSKKVAMSCRIGRKEMFYLTTHSTHFILWLYGVGHMVKDHLDSEIGNLLPPHGLLFLISSKEGRKEMVYLMTHSTHFIYGYMVSGIW